MIIINTIEARITQNHNWLNKKTNNINTKNDKMPFISIGSFNNDIAPHVIINESNDAMNNKKLFNHGILDKTIVCFMTFSNISKMLFGIVAFIIKIVLNKVIISAKIEFNNSVISSPNK